MASYVLQPFQSATAIFRGPADHGTIVLTVKGFAPEFNYGFQLDELSKAPDLVIAVRAWTGPHSQKLAGFTALFLIGADLGSRRHSAERTAAYLTYAGAAYCAWAFWAWIVSPGTVMGVPRPYAAGRLAGSFFSVNSAGTLFACQQAEVTPDILCLAKGLTGGSLPLAATLCTEDIFAAHYSTDRSRTFFHSSSFTANPIACAAARANLDIWRDEPVLERIAALAALQEARLRRLGNRFENARRLGTIAAMDLKVADPGYLANVALDLSR
jgi:hypothetical protein